MDKKRPDNYQIEDFVSDESFINYHFHLNSDDQKFWEDWLQEHPDNKVLVEAAKVMLQTLTLTLPEDEFNEELAKLKEAINEEQPLFIREQPSIFRFLNWDKSSRSPGNRKRRGVQLLLPVLFVLFVGAYFLVQYFAKPTFQLSERFNHSSAPIVFVLSDSTVVTLAPQSSLQYPGKFVDNDRKVYLEGEAQFHVKRDTAHPFKVYAAEVVATVLGTIFNIKEHQGDSIVQVELLQGKLRVETVDSAGSSVQSTILNPDERVVFNRHQKKLHKESWQQNKERITANSHLKFNQDGFEAIAMQLKNIFGVTVINQSNKKDWRFTGEFNNSSVEDIIENICIVKKLSYQVQGDTILIK